MHVTDTTPKPNLISLAATIVGNETALAELCGVTPQAINKAVRAYQERGEVSAELARDIEKATKGEIKRWMLRPDLWEPPRFSRRKRKTSKQPES